MKRKVVDDWRFAGSTKPAEFLTKYTVHTKGPYLPLLDAEGHKFTYEKFKEFKDVFALALFSRPEVKFQHIEEVLVFNGPIYVYAFVMKPNKVCKTRHVLLCVNGIAEYNPQRDGNTTDYWMKNNGNVKLLIGAYDLEGKNTDAKIKSFCLQQINRFYQFWADTFTEALHTLK